MNFLEDAATPNTAKDYTTLLRAYQTQRSARTTPVQNNLITFSGIGEHKDAYNPSGPFVAQGITYQWARIESRDKQDAVSMLFQKVDETTYALVDDAPVLPLEDPFLSVIHGEFVVGGVQIAKDEHEHVIGYRTVFYKGTSLQNLTECAVGPESMKDIRLVQLPRHERTSKIFVFTRPYIPIHARMMGRIAVTTINSLDELTAERLQVENTQLLSDFFVDAEWGGVNDAYVLEDGLLGALCHIATFDEQGKRHYAAGAFVLDSVSLKCSSLEIIAERADFPNGPIKIMPENQNNPDRYDDLADVIFSSRLTPLNGTIDSAQILQLTCGLSDAAVGTCTIENPFPRLVQEYYAHSV